MKAGSPIDPILSLAIQSEPSKLMLLTRLIEHEQYHDHYAGQDPTEQSHHSLHGLTESTPSCRCL